MQALTRSMRLASPFIAATRHTGVKLQPCLPIITIRYKSHQEKSHANTADAAKVVKTEHTRRKDEHHTKEAKDPKNLTLNGKIASHDFESKVKNIQKWLKKGHRVNTVIQGDAELAEQLYLKLEVSLQGEGRLLQKRNKDGDVRFYIDSVPKTAEKES